MTIGSATKGGENTPGARAATFYVTQNHPHGIWSNLTMISHRNEMVNRDRVALADVERK
uniref:Uncharacterized protein n=1 Tax=Candidozyma auris TaxID=498019 RepID=A0A0L0P8M1_CANAR